MIGTGGVSLAASYFASSVILTLSGLGLVFWGAILLFVSPQRYVPEKMSSAMAVSMTKSIDRLLQSLNCKGRTIFLHPKHLKGLSQGYVFIPHELKDTSELPSDEALEEERLVYDDPRGIFMVAPSSGLVELLEKEIDTNLATLDMEHVKDILPKLLVNNLRMIDRLTFEEDQGAIRAVMEGESAANVCATITKETTVGAHFGCPLCASIGLIISKVTGKPVFIEENKVDEINSIISTAYRTVNV